MCEVERGLHRQMTDSDNILVLKLDSRCMMVTIN